MTAPTILVVEDNAITRKMVRVALESDGYTVLLAADGASALERAAEHPPDLVLQDLVLPDMDGFDLVKRLRALEGQARTPIIAFTGFVTRAEDARIVTAGFDGLLAKPVEPSRLLSAVRRYLRAAGSTTKPARATAHVLLVDDNPSLRKLHALQLEQLGFEVVTAASGPEALNLAIEAPPDIILSDLLMPGMDGFHLVAAVREEPALAAIPVILVTANYLEEADREAAARVGAQALLQRSPNLDGVADAIRVAVEGGVPKGSGRDAHLVLGEDYSTRFLARLEEQADANLGLSQRAALQAAALTALAAIADALGRRADIEVAVEEVLARCVDAAGLSRAVVLLRRPDGRLRCATQIGFEPRVRAELEDYLHHHRDLDALLSRGLPVSLTPAGHAALGPEFLATVGASSALIAPIASAGESLGLLVLTSATRLLSGDDWTAFAHTIASQLGQAIALSRAFASLRTSENRYRTLFETVNLIALALDARGNVDYVNPFFLKLAGYTREEVVGRSWFDFLPAAQRAGVFSEIIERDFFEHFQNAVVTRSGEERMIAWHNTVLRGEDGKPIGTLSMGEDITERLRAEAAMRDSEERFRQLAENLHEVFFITELATGIGLYISPAYEEIWGRSTASAVAAPYAWTEGFHPDDMPAIHAALDAVLTQGGATVVARVIRPDKSVRWVRSRLFPVHEADGSVHRLVGVTEDITELRQTELQLAQAQKMEAVGLLAGGIAHDFNNLLAAITVFTELASAGMPADAQSRDDLDQVQGAVQRAMALTRQLLSFSRQQVVQPRVLDFNAVIAEVEKMLRRVIGEDVALEARLSPSAGAIRADPSQVEQILMNLAVNARDAMPGGGTLIIATSARDVGDAEARNGGLAHPGRYAVLTITDTGTGMDEHTRERIFEPFFTTKGRKGTGLGLATVYSIVRQSGGHVSVASTPGQGTTFTILMPQVLDAPDATAARASGDVPRGTETILLAEDDPAVRRACTTTLKRLGYTVLVAETGEEALHALEHHPGRIDLVIADVVMPGLDGIQLVERLRALKPGIRAMLASGYASDVIARHGGMPPDIPFLEKPFSASVLALRVREVLDS